MPFEWLLIAASFAFLYVAAGMLTAIALWGHVHEGLPTEDNDDLVIGLIAKWPWYAGLRLAAWVAAITSKAIRWRMNR